MHASTASGRPWVLLHTSQLPSSSGSSSSNSCVVESSGLPRQLSMSRWSTVDPSGVWSSRLPCKLVTRKETVASRPRAAANSTGL